MADGAVTESSKPSPEQKANSRAGKFADWLKNFGRRKKLPLQKNTPVQHPEVKQESLVEPAESELKPRNPALQDELDLALKVKKIPPPPDFESQGASGFFGTNERLNPAVMESIKVSEDSPDGYIVGAGVSSMIACLEMFNAETDPKGLVFINIDPDSVADIKVFIEGLRMGQVVYRDGGGSERKLSSDEYQGTDPYDNGEHNIDTNNMLLKHADRLIRLSKEGKIAVIQQDLFNKELLESIRSLEGFEQSNNVVYLSNIGDWIRREGAWGKNGIGPQEIAYMAEHPGNDGLSKEYRDKFWEEKYASFENLNILNPETPRNNYYVDTSEYRDYQLQVNTEIPDKINYFGRSPHANSNN